MATDKSTTTTKPKQQRDAHGHFLPMTGSPRARIAALTAQAHSLDQQLQVKTGQVQGLSNILQQISATFCDQHQWECLPSEVDTLARRCENYGQKAERLGEANTALIIERDNLRAQIEGLHSDLSTAQGACQNWETTAEELRDIRDRLARDLRDVQTGNEWRGKETKRLEAQIADMTPLIPAWARWLAGLVVVAIIDLVAHRLGFHPGQGVIR